MNIIIFIKHTEILYSIKVGYERHFILVPKYSSITLSFFLPVSYLSVFNLCVVEYNNNNKLHFI
jgi:hypothetical protein